MLHDTISTSIRTFIHRVFSQEHNTIVCYYHSEFRCFYASIFRLLSLTLRSLLLRTKVRCIGTMYRRAILPGFCLHQSIVLTTTTMKYTRFIEALDVFFSQSSFTHIDSAIICLRCIGMIASYLIRAPFVHFHAYSNHKATEVVEYWVFSTNFHLANCGFSFGGQPIWVYSALELISSSTTSQRMIEKWFR